MKKYIKFVNISLWIIVLVFGLLCCHRKPKPVTTTTVVYKYDTVEKKVSVFAPAKPIKIITPADTFIQMVPYIDSTYCKQLAVDFYTRNIYSQTLVDDSILTASIVDTICQNKIGNRSFKYRINRPQTIIINTPMVAEKPAFSLSIGATVTKLPANFSIGPSALVNYKKTSIGYTYDFVNRYHQMTYFFKIVGK